MAIYNEILAGRYARAVQKLFSVKGSVPTKQVSGEVSIAHPLFSGVENRFIESWERFGISFNVAAAAANTSCVRVRNPAGSNVIIVLERICFSVDTQQTMNITFGKDSTDLATVAGLGNTNLDVRGQPGPTGAGGRIGPTLVMSRQNTTVGAPALATSSQLESLNIAANTPREVVLYDDLQIPLSPGGALQIANGTVNTNLATSWIWRERGLEESERS